MGTEVLNAISQTELIRLENHESTIELGRKAAFAAGRALREIRDDKLFRGTHATFEEYTQSRWKFTKARASQLIGFHDFMLETFPEEMATAVNGQPIPQGLPDNERYVRELKRLPANQQKECWTQIEQLTADGEPKLTLSFVRTTVDAWLAPSLAPAPGEGTSFDSPATKEVKSDNGEDDLTVPLAPAKEENAIEATDRIASSTVHTIQRDYRMVPIAGKTRFFHAVAEAVKEIEVDLFPESGGELTDVDLEAALDLLADEIDLLPLGSTAHKATWIAQLTKHLLDPRRMPTPYRAAVAGGVEIVASAAGLQVTAGERHGVIDWDLVHEFMSNEEVSDG